MRTLLGTAVLLPALLAGPWALARLFRPRADRADTAALAAALAVAQALAVAVALHVGGMPINSVTLATVHLAVAALAVGTLVFLRLPFRAAPAPGLRDARWVALACAVILLPVTHLTGEDTHKWQDLATNVRVEQAIPWLVHPLSLAGYTPRAYPSAHPLLLATVQTLGGLGVDAGFYAVSVSTALAGFAAFLALARRLFPAPATALFASACYVFAPVFLRYTYWATGRGLFLALYPLLILALVDRRPWRALLLAPPAALLLLATHKAAAAAILVVTLSTALAWAVPRRLGWTWRAAAAVPCAALAILVAPPTLLPGLAGHAAGFVRLALTRFAWLLPLAGLGAFVARRAVDDPARRRLTAAAYAAIPLAFTPDMYGALVALPVVVVAAVDGLEEIARRRPALGAPLRRAALAATALAGGAVLVHRAMPATPGRVYRAAMALEQYDPRGPYRVEAPGWARVRIQAYVSGCPRFAVRRAPDAGVRLFPRPWPGLRGAPLDVYRDWCRYLRHAVDAGATETDWYGDGAGVYRVVIDGAGQAQGRRIYDAEGIQIYAGGDAPSAAVPRTGRSGTGADCG